MPSKNIKKNVKKNTRKNHTALVQGAEPAIDRMKYEIAQEFSVKLGPNTTSRANGSVGGEITKRLVALAKKQFNGKSK
ncbi:alpha/beta-type small acid-soluble spore protein [Bacillus sp. CDB3]|uniref:alpha/beta-type small acid-soluble spore protein n=1 Tax=Bacillus sp. CDB3 TaxID=360310 RepID=UPI0009D82246|nr:alpha/beta-type small acid-soluble spore protein [Bacillus sp. CDB3]OQR53347.1 spore protein [Bacillus sp. CDB3]